jgi:hypothetical protein
LYCNVALSECILGRMQPGASYLDLIARNVRVARAAVTPKLSQAGLAKRMQRLGFKEWRRQTVGNTERGQRRVTLEEALGLVVALEVSWGNLLFPAAGDMRLVSLPAGQPVILPLQHEMPEGVSGVWWNGTEPKITAPGPGEDTADGA